MAAPLSKSQLFSIVLAAIRESGWIGLTLDRRHPFLFRVMKADGAAAATLRVYIWNCTHGGGAARAADEFRVQLTGVVPERAPGEITLLLGWHEGYEVFVGFDISKHAGQASSSPSIQVRENALLNAHNRSFSVHERGNREVAVAFRAEFLVDYALNQAELHGFSKATEKELEIANEIDSVSESEIQKEVGDPKRREVISTIKQKYRAHDFRARVLAAYSHACAMCGTQLKLVEAAHVLPVAVAGSTDETSNGIALCSLHHSAYDSALVSFDEKYRVEISSMALGGLKEAKLVGGLAEFQSNLKPAIILPADKRDYPDPKYVAQSRKLRNWRG